MLSTRKHKVFNPEARPALALPLQFRRNRGWFNGALRLGLAVILEKMFCTFNAEIARNLRTNSIKILISNTFSKEPSSRTAP
jgi:hypothetical protein